MATTPPSIDAKVSSAVVDARKVFEENADAIITKLIEDCVAKAFAGTSNTPLINIEQVRKLVDTVLIPQMHYWEGSWSEHPTDKNGVSMRGVLLGVLTSTFDDLFIKTDIAPVKEAAIKLNDSLPKWKTDLTLGKQVLFTLNTSAKVAGLFIYKFLTSGAARYPFAIMTIDPWLGFFYASCCFSSGADSYKKIGFDTAAKKYGLDPERYPAQWCNSHLGLNNPTDPNKGMNTPALGTSLIGVRYQYIMDLTKDGSPSSEFRSSWLDRLFNNNKSDLAMLIIINELFNLNAKQLFTFNDNEKKYLNKLAAYYTKLNIQIPD
jgi:hypothetical protein